MVNMNYSNPRPELLVSYPSEGVVELKVEDWKLLGGDAGRKRKQQAIDLVILFLFIFSWFELRALKTQLFQMFWTGIAALYFYDKSTQVLYESVIIIPHHGIQLETHRGLQYSLLPSCPLTTKRRFMPLTSVRDVVINEAFRRWDVRYYLCVIRDAGPEVSLEVAFETLLPPFPILEVARSHIHRILSQTAVPAGDWAGPAM